MLPALAAALDAELHDLRARDRLRTLPALGGDSRTRALLAEAPVVSFSSNDYLGLAAHPALRRAADEATAQFGFGSGASRLVAGDLPPHRRLEQALAEFLRVPACLLFPTGYQANLGLLGTLAGPDDLIVSDALNHASLIDGCRLSRATVRVYRHGDVSGARDALSGGAFRRRILVTESVFSMDGDVAPLGALAELARASEASLVVDEAHAVGLLGRGGRGLCAAAGVEPDALVGTLGKAFGAFGGFVAGAHVLRRILENRARTFLFTTSPPPSLPAAAAAALSIIAGPAGDQLRARLTDNIRRLEAALPSLRAPAATATPILPIILGADDRAVAASRRVRDGGFFVQPIRPPTVPEGSARLRVTLSAAHEHGEIDAFADALRPLLAP